MTVCDCGSVVDSPCAPARLRDVRLAEPGSRFPANRNKVGCSRAPHLHLNAIPRLIGTGVTTGPGLPARADNLIRNT